MDQNMWVLESHRRTSWYVITGLAVNGPVCVGIGISQNNLMYVKTGIDNGLAVNGPEYVGIVISQNNLML